jgi:hypothetical protein
MVVLAGAPTHIVTMASATHANFQYPLEIGLSGSSPCLLEVKCHRYDTKASIPPMRFTGRAPPHLEAGGITQMPLVPQGTICPARAHDPAPEEREIAPYV